MVAQFVDVGADADYVLGAEGLSLGPDQAQRVLARLVDQRGQVADLAAHKRFRHRFEAADQPERIDRRAQHQFQGGVAHTGQVPHRLAQVGFVGS